MNVTLSREMALNCKGGKVVVAGLDMFKLMICI